MTHPVASGNALEHAMPAADAAPIYRKITRRLIPFLFLCYVLNYIDRLNIGFAKLGFSQDLGFTDAVFGVGVAMFFVGYLLCELPGTLMLARWGARRSIARIMILWGLCTIATMFITTPAQFYGIRALLGAAEAGFLPGIILYLTYWYPAAQRGRVTAMFMASMPVAGILSGPLAGGIMSSMARFDGLRDWQWLFLLEGVPAIVLGLIAWFYLSDSPQRATWLTPAERGIVTAALGDKTNGTSQATRPHGALRSVLRDPRIYVVAFLGFASYCSANTIAFWTPTIIKGSGVTDKLTIGMLSALPPLAGLIGMIWNGRHSDRTMERRWHAAGAALVAAIGLGLLPIFHDNTPMAVTLLTLAGAGHFAFVSASWTIPPAYLGRSSAAAGIGIIASLSSLGGVIVPTILGWAKTSLGSFAVGLYLVVGILLMAVVVMLVFIPAHALRDTAAR